jgi:hypothetical protein
VRTGLPLGSHALGIAEPHRIANCQDAGSVEVLRQLGSLIVRPVSHYRFEIKRLVNQLDVFT